MPLPDLEETLSLDSTEAVLKLSEQLDGLDPNELTLPQKKFQFVFGLESQVNNGGFSQYFYNSAGDYAHATLAALEEMGENKVHALLAKAIKVFPNAKVPVDRNERTELIDEMGEAAEEKWEAIDDKYYESGIDLAPILIDFVRKHRTEF